jgi:hypothetical protein
MKIVQGELMKDSDSISKKRINASVTLSLTVIGVAIEQLIESSIRKLSTGKPTVQAFILLWLSTIAHTVDN